MIKEYLQLSRAHNIPSETIPAILGAALAYGTLFRFEVLLWGLFGVLYHFAGYSMNSVSDWKSGYDKNDEFKQHHPLNTGAIELEDAERFVKILFIITFFYGLIIVYPSYRGFVIMLVGALMGIVYNLAGKTTKFKFIFISAAHTTLFIAPYIAEGGSKNLVFLLTTCYVFLWVVHQISVLGEVKDITQEDEENFIKRLGVDIYVDNFQQMVKFSPNVKFYSIGIKLVTVLLGVGVALLLNMDQYLFLVFLSTAYIPLIYAYLIVTNGPVRRTVRISFAAKSEMATAFFIILAVAPVLTVEGAVLLVLGSIIWVLMFNKITWSTWLAPAT